MKIMERFLVCVMVILIPSTVSAASMADISRMLWFPLKWTTTTINYKTSSACVSNISPGSWILGGKAIGVNNDISNTVRKELFTQTAFTTTITDKTLQLPGSFPGQYIASPGMFCTLSSQTAFGTFSGVTKMCYLGGNDGSSNNPQCGCCSVELSSNGNVKCDDLDTFQICPPVFSSCVINEPVRNRALQIGGTSGTNSVKNILCFDISTQQYTSSVSTLSLLTTETSTFDVRCEYGNLATSAYEVGCDFLPNDLSRSLIVVGGRTTETGVGGELGFLDTVQVCKANQNCQIQTLKLPQPTSQMRVLGLTNCIFVAFGGSTVNGPLGKLYVGDICGQQWLTTESLPAMLTEFSLVYGNNVLCLYGGVVNNQLQNTAFCTNFTQPVVPTTPRPTRKPTKRPTMKPTRKPTLTPTLTPTVPGQGYPQFYQGWGTIFDWGDGRDSQACHANDNNLFVLGGKDSAQGSLKTLSVFDFNFNQLIYQMFQYNALLSLQSMTPFYCPNGCSGGYKNRLYLVNPRTDDGSTTPRLFECTIVSQNKTALCKDLCDSNIGILPYCSSILFWDACVTSQNQFLYIVGGRDSQSTRNTITVFDMAKRDWASVPQGSPASTKYPTLYGTLPTSVINHACATWDFHIFIFGGETTSNSATNTIQKCEKNGDCVTQNAKLNIGRYYASAETIGSSIVVLCGAHDSQTVTDIVELYDIAADSITVDYNGESSGLVIPSARRSCCVKRWDSQSTLVMTGGVALQGSYSTSVSSLSAAPYGIQDNAASGKPLSQCDNILLQSSNPSFSGYYFYYADIKQYRVWVSDLYDSVIYYQPDHYDYTWIGNLSSQTWSYYPNSGFSSDYWTVLATRTTVQQSILFDFTCLDRQTYKKKGSGNGSTILGIQRTIFIVIVVVVVVAAVLIMAGIMIWYFVRKQKYQQREITIQSSSFGLMKKMLKSGSSLAVVKGDEQTSTASGLTKTVTHNRDAGMGSMDDGTIQEEARPLTEKEIEAIERGGVLIKGYPKPIVSINANDPEESLSSVDSRGVDFADHKVFTKTGEDNNPLKRNEVVNPVTGEIERLKRPHKNPANRT